MTEYTFCEPVQILLAFTPIHLREIQPGRARQLGGYPAKEAHPTLCGRVPYYGWDLEGEVDLKAVEATLNASVHPLCPRCADAWKRANGLVPPEPERSVQGYRPSRLIVDEVSDVGF